MIIAVQAGFSRHHEMFASVHAVARWDRFLVAPKAPSLKPSFLLESRVSEWDCQAYGLTEDEVAIM